MTSGKRGPLDQYFTRTAAPNSKKVKTAAADGPADGAKDVAAAAADGKPALQGSPIPPVVAQQQQAAAAGGSCSSKPSSTSDPAAASAGSTAAAGPAAAAPAGALGALMSAARGKAQQQQQQQQQGAGLAGQQQLSMQEMQELASRNKAAALAAVQAAAQAGQQPQLKSLLVEPSWLQVLAPEFDKPYAAQLQSFLQQEWAAGTVYPPKECIFAAFNSVPFDQVRVVILGQDPYINQGEAMGLSFSVPRGVRVPPSLANMYKELAADLGCTTPNHGCLEKWTRQGVLLLNACLSVRAKASNSHAGKGWEGVTSAALAALAQRRSGIVFLLWGKFAQDRCAKLDMRRHHVLKSVHPSPLSAHRGFLGCRHFSATNKLLQESGLPAIDWQIDSV
uniref:Uracil-DNA glycosylase n=1 Tax=Tetradesmus obliquus TaxID=3088 RepID=A0A383VXT9_TETOB|eukprot:jgi/Sobl393_1/19744/SZX70021.1